MSPALVSLQVAEFKSCGIITGIANPWTASSVCNRRRVTSVFNRKEKQENNCSCSGWEAEAFKGLLLHPCCKDGSVSGIIVYWPEHHRKENEVHRISRLNSHINKQNSFLSFIIPPSSCKAAISTCVSISNGSEMEGKLLSSLNICFYLLGLKGLKSFLEWKDGKHWQGLQADLVWWGWTMRKAPAWGTELALLSSWAHNWQPGVQNVWIGRRVWRE